MEKWKERETISLIFILKQLKIKKHFFKKKKRESSYIKKFLSIFV